MLYVVQLRNLCDDVFLPSYYILWKETFSCICFLQFIYLTFQIPFVLFVGLSHSIEVIALGNGQASRETGMWLSQLISSGRFHPLTVRYAVVPEAGASVYSASIAACSELASLDVSMRGAVSIARRLQDPLAEWHDLPERRLVAAVNATLEECISFVGVDVNAAPVHILSRVAGLSESKAKAIVEHRSRIGRFPTRAYLLKVCFVRVRTVSRAGVNARALDLTISDLKLNGSIQSMYRTIMFHL
ncbi:unnamed protein product [Echinostoma caproni]|uniref:Tex_YqgF domain-containing protein n=1 Tax=Echinostoma caproni TaxID=27848 RepID=A0A183B784_9TREM|nr:unnamed protein product [Echinostoma caproni]